MFLKRQLLIICIIPVFSSQNSFAMEKEFHQDINLIPVMSMMVLPVAIMAALFGDRYDVRTQIRDNLALTGQGLQISTELYLLPILCIGTGRCREVLDRQPRKTIIFETDTCIDFSSRIQPDYACDAWEIWKIADGISSESFGFIFFAHAGYHPPFCEPERLERALETYLDLLAHGGVFVFNSEVFIQSDAPDQLAMRHSHNSFEEWKADWVREFANAGFQQIEVIVKDESSWNPGFVSILLVARKS